MKVPKLDAKAMPVRPTTDRTPTAAMTDETTASTQSAACGVLKVPCIKESISGSSRSSAMPQVTRTAVFIQLKVVPTTAIATVTAIDIMNPNPIPGRTWSPKSLAISPIGALEAAAAARPATVLVVAAAVAVAAVVTVAVNFSLTIYPAAKYSIKYAMSPWI